MTILDCALQMVFISIQFLRPIVRFINARSLSYIHVGITRWNAIRIFTVGCEKWMFSDSVEEREASTIIYIMVEMMKTHSINIYYYLSYVLE